jgi:Family of unknown function (DUF6428)
MKTSEFLDALRSRPELPLEFSTAAGSVPAGYHLTEVKRVVHDTVDCGSMAHSWTENHFELWSPADSEPGSTAMRAGRFLSIVEKVQSVLSIDERAEARVFGSVGGGPDQLHEVASIETRNNSITVHLEPVSAQCKARDRREEVEGGSSSGCCTMAAGSKLAQMCGCEARKPSPPSDSNALGIDRVRNMWFTPFESQGFRFMF